MGIKKKKLRERAQSDYVRFMKHAESAIELASSSLHSEIRLRVHLMQAQSKMNQMREDHADAIRQAKDESAGRFPIIVNARSFVTQLAQLPPIPPGSRPHFSTYAISVSTSPEHTHDARPGFSRPNAVEMVTIQLGVSQVVVPGMRGRSQFGYKIPAGVVLVGMD